ncbi:MAG: hypothetical protein WC867_01670 [Candidatus Pacearchaeota archaeon]|jgi:hypothetical protein
MNRIRKGLYSILLGASSLLINQGSYCDEVKDPFDPTKIIIVENGPSESEFNNARNRLIENGVSKTLVEKIENKYLIAYSKLLNDYSSKVIEKTLELHSVYPGGMDSPHFLYRYANIMSEVDNDTLKSIKEFRKNNPKRNNLDMIKVYIQSIKNNVPLEILTELSDEELVYWGINSNFFMPKDFLENYTFEPYKKSIEFGMNIIGKNDPIQLRDDLIKEIGKREHETRYFLDYNESANQLKEIEDPVIIGLIKGYNDFLSKPENIILATQLFEPINDNIKTERLAMIRFSKDGLFFEHVTMNDLFKEKGYFLASENRCYLPPSLYFVEKAMNLHSHILTIGAKAQIYPGPSGLMKEPFVYGDSLVLSLSNKYNPYQIDGVVSELGKSRADFDIIFRRVKYQEGKPINYGDCIVIDMGVFEY